MAKKYVPRPVDDNEDEMRLFAQAIQGGAAPAEKLERIRIALNIASSAAPDTSPALAAQATKDLMEAAAFIAKNCAPPEVYEAMFEKVPQKRQAEAAAPVTPAPVESKALPEIMTIEEAAAYLRMHPQVLYRHVRQGTVPASRVGRTIRFKKSVLDEFLEQGAWKSVGKFLKFVENQREQAGRRRYSEEVD
ncbi:MAG TPA: helix-turn-helix domain-containing protein [Planctomycetota bacterium]|nr:helix-turn-helix domain-containing protein [Planctomycetota bacterium]